MRAKENVACRWPMQTEAIAQWEEEHSNLANKKKQCPNLSNHCHDINAHDDKKTPKQRKVSRFILFG